jgi:hypothetical protein
VEIRADVAPHSYWTWADLRRYGIEKYR